MPGELDPTDTSINEVHFAVCEEASWVANNQIYADQTIPAKWKGYVFRNASPYNNNGLTIDITPEFANAPKPVKRKYLRIGREAMRRAITLHGSLFAGAIVGEAKAGRNYFDRWDQTPTRLF